MLLPEAGDLSAGRVGAGLSPPEKGRGWRNEGSHERESNGAQGLLGSQEEAGPSRGWGLRKPGSSPGIGLPSGSQGAAGAEPAGEGCWADAACSARQGEGGSQGLSRWGVAAAGRGKRQPLRPGERALRVPSPTPGH